MTRAKTTALSIVVVALAWGLAMVGWLPAPDAVAAEAPRDDHDAEVRSEDDPLALASPRHRRWLEDVALLMTDAERRVFLDLRQSYQRDAFIARFWDVRDPFPQTVRNEFRDRWQERVAEARKLYTDLDGEAQRAILLFGPPTRRTTITCQLLRQPVEVWNYDGGSDLVRGVFTLVFQGLSLRGRGVIRTWSPRDGLSYLVSPGGVRGILSDARLGQMVAQECSDGHRLLEGLALALDIEDVLAKTNLVPKVNDEWVLTFRARSTEVPKDAPRLSGQVAVSFPGRHQSRTVVQALVSVPRHEATPAQLGAHRGFHFLVDGEVLRQGELFEQFRYRFDLPADDGAGAVEDNTARLPLVVQRNLRPGEYTLVLKLEDTAGKSYFRDQRQIQVPRVEPRRRPVAVAADGTLRQLTENELASVDEEAFAELSAVNAPAAAVATAEARLAEANASLSTGDHVVQLRPLPQELLTGPLRVEASARGVGIDKVMFLLNDRPVMSKRAPPYSVELNLGAAPRIHTLRAVAVDGDGEFLAADEVLVNAGPHRFDVRLLEPQQGRKYSRSVRAHAEVDVPEGEILDRVELFLDETRVATLYQPPFEQPILLPPDVGLAYVRAVAYLADGGSTEAVQFINAPDFVDELKVHFVELFTSVLDRKGDFARGLTMEDFEVFEEGEAQAIRRFETMDDLPIRAGLVLDTSLSMEKDLREVEKAAYRFLETVLEPRDRACLITFADAPRLAVRFTNDPAVLAGGLSGLVAEGETALYDSVVYALHYFAGLKGKRAIIVLTDGEDSASRYTYEEAVEFARRTGASIYVIALGLESSAPDVRAKLAGLTRETGGELFFIDAARNLGRVYETIQHDLRSQYLLAYQSSTPASAEAFRRVEIRVKQKGLEAKSLRGYYP